MKPPAEMADDEAQGIVDKWVRCGIPDPVSDQPWIWGLGLHEGRYTGEVYHALPGSVPDEHYGDVKGGVHLEQQAAAMLADAFGRSVKVMWGPTYCDHGDFGGGEEHCDLRAWEDAYLIQVDDPATPDTFAIVPSDPYDLTADVPGAVWALAGDRTDLIREVLMLV